jgi:hypothetical protein
MSEKLNAYTIFVGKPEVKRPLGRPDVDKKVKLSL